MAQDTIIAWTSHTFNIAWGCVKVSPGCFNCYADTLSSRYKFNVWGPTAPRRTFGKAHWDEPLKWNRIAERDGRRVRVFSSSMCDNFEDHPTIDEERAKLWELIRATPWLDWQILTKRIERVENRLPRDWGEGWPNVWLGTSVENQEYAELRIPILLRLPAAVRFISYEPALGPIDFNFDEALHPDWVIYGGESGPGFRPAKMDWARSARDQCKAAGVAFFHKQSSGYRTEMGIELDGNIVREYPTPIEAKR